MRDKSFSESGKESNHSGSVLNDQIVMEGRLAEMAKMHSREAFYALYDQLETTIFSVLVELMKELANEGNQYRYIAARSTS